MLPLLLHVCYPIEISTMLIVTEKKFLRRVRITAAAGHRPMSERQQLEDRFAEARAHGASGTGRISLKQQMRRNQRAKAAREQRHSLRGGGVEKEDARD